MSLFVFPICFQRFPMLYQNTIALLKWFNSTSVVFDVREKLNYIKHLIVGTFRMLLYITSKAWHPWMYLTLLTAYIPLLFLACYYRCEFFQKTDRSTENFDHSFLKLPTKMTPPDWEVLENLKGDEFSNFSFVNPFYVKDVEPWSYYF